MKLKDTIGEVGGRHGLGTAIVAVWLSRTVAQSVGSSSLLVVIGDRQDKTGRNTFLVTIINPCTLTLYPFLFLFLYVSLSVMSSSCSQLARNERYHILHILFYKKYI